MVPGNRKKPFGQGLSWRILALRLVLYTFQGTALKFLRVLPPGVRLPFPGLHLKEAGIMALGDAMAEEGIEIAPVSPQLPRRLHDSLDEVSLHSTVKRTIDILMRAIENMKACLVFIVDKRLLYGSIKDFINPATYQRSHFCSADIRWDFDARSHLKKSILSYLVYCASTYFLALRAEALLNRFQKSQYP